MQVKFNVMKNQVPYLIFLFIKWYIYFFSLLFYLGYSYIFTVKRARLEVLISFCFSLSDLWESRLVSFCHGANMSLSAAASQPQTASDSGMSLAHDRPALCGPRPHHRTRTGTGTGFWVRCSLGLRYIWARLFTAFWAPHSDKQYTPSPNSLLTRGKCSLDSSLFQTLQYPTPSPWPLQTFLTLLTDYTSEHET